MGHDFPKWQNVRYHYDIWAAPDENGDSVLDRILRRLVEEQREQEYRNAQTTMIIADSAEEKSYDAGKDFQYQAAHRR